MKKLLLIMPKMYGYENIIKRTFENQGYTVDLLFENFYTQNFLYKILFKTKAISAEKLFWYFYFHKLKKDKTYTDILIIRGSSVTSKILEHAKNLYPKANFYMYQWDTVKNNQSVLKLASMFDSVKTFDMVDAEKYGWKYTPLFYINESFRSNKRKYDYTYICTNHSDRVMIYNELINKYKNMKPYFYFYIGIVDYVKNKYILKNIAFKNLNYKSFHFKPISPNETNKIMSESSIVIDYTHPNQNGFTMRTIESLGNRCKLVTNNKNILKADFYNSDNIYVYEIDNFNIPESFVVSNYVEIDENIMKRYSVEEWCKELLTL